MTGNSERTWVVATGLDIVETGGRLVVRHRDLVEQHHLGVSVKAASWVPELLTYLETSRTGAELAERFPFRSLDTVLNHLHRNGVVFADRRDEEAFLVHAAGTVLARRAMRAAAAARVVGRDLRDHGRAAELVARTRELCDALGAVTGELESAATSFTEAQVERLGVAEAGGLKLHLGCGGNLIPGWVNTDIVDGDVRVDLRRGLPFPDRAAAYVYTCHMLEHLAHPGEAMPLLREIHRVLRPGGIVRIVVPDIEPLLRAYTADDREFFTERSQYWTWADPSASLLAQFLDYAGANRDPFDLIGHKYGYDFETLAAALAEAGFSPAVRGAYQESAHPELRIDDWSEAASFTVRGEHLSLFVEAQRPATPTEGDGDD